ncbi:MAG: hypothetical protein AB7T06_29310 [Kofleriaceae bacterium]
MAYLMTGFNLARVGSMSFNEVDDGTDSGTPVLVASSGRYAHRDLSSVMGSGLYTSFASAVQSALNAVLTTHGCTVTFSASTLRYTLTFAGGPTLVDFSSTAGFRLAAALGFTYAHADASGGSSSDPWNFALSGASSYVGNALPWYLFELGRDGVSVYSRAYESRGQTKRVMSSSSNAYSRGPTAREKRVDWTVRFENLETVFADEDAASEWAYEDLITHARAHEPILLHTSTLDVVAKNMEGDFHDGARKPVWNDFHGKWDLPFLGQYLGAL